jgi:hypothetical protein
MGKSLFNCSFYSHPEIRKFQGVTAYLVQIRVLVQTMETLIWDIGSRSKGQRERSGSILHKTARQPPTDRCTFSKTPPPPHPSERHSHARRGPWSALGNCFMKYLQEAFLQCTILQGGSMKYNWFVIDKLFTWILLYGFSFVPDSPRGSRWQQGRICGIGGCSPPYCQELTLNLKE